MADSVVVQIRRLPHAQGLSLPEYMTSGSSGMDVYAALTEPVTIRPGEICVVPTGLCVALPPGYEFQVRPRSGLAIKSGVTVVNAPGTIDADYRGEVKVGLINLGQAPWIVERGQRIAQMVLSRVWTAQWREADELPVTERNQGGFGHTGV